MMQIAVRGIVLVENAMETRCRGRETTKSNRGKTRLGGCATFSVIDHNHAHIFVALLLSCLKPEYSSLLTYPLILPTNCSEDNGSQRQVS